MFIKYRKIEASRFGRAIMVDEWLHRDRSIGFGGQKVTFLVKHGFKVELINCCLNERIRLYYIQLIQIIPVEAYQRIVVQQFSTRRILLLFNNNGCAYRI